MMFSELSAWFSDSVDNATKTMWKDNGGQEVGFDTAKFIFSSSNTCPDTLSVFSSQEYQREHLAVFHSRYVQDCVRAGDRSEVVLGRYFLPPQEIVDMTKTQIMYCWDAPVSHAQDAASDDHQHRHQPATPTTVQHHHHHHHHHRTASTGPPPHRSSSSRQQHRESHGRKPHRSSSTGSTRQQHRVDTDAHPHPHRSLLPPSTSQHPQAGLNQGSQGQAPKAGPSHASHGTDPKAGPSHISQGIISQGGSSHTSHGTTPKTRPCHASHGTVPKAGPRHPSRGTIPKAGPSHASHGTTPKARQSHPSKGTTPKAGHNHPSHGTNPQVGLSHTSRRTIPKAGTGPHLQTSSGQGSRPQVNGGYQNLQDIRTRQITNVVEQCLQTRRDQHTTSRLKSFDSRSPQISGHQSRAISCAHGNASGARHTFTNVLQTGRAQTCQSGNQTTPVNEQSRSRTVSQQETGEREREERPGPRLVQKRSGQVSSPELGSKKSRQAPDAERSSNRIPVPLYVNDRNTGNKDSTERGERSREARPSQDPDPTRDRRSDPRGEGQGARSSGHDNSGAVHISQLQNVPLHELTDFIPGQNGASVARL